MKRGGHSKCELGASYTQEVTGRVRTSALQRLDQPTAVFIVIMAMRVSSEDPMRVRVGVRQLMVMAFAFSNGAIGRCPFVGAVFMYPPPCGLYHLAVSM
jgi:hypothetical protein